jgi:hypothetical protein
MIVLFPSKPGLREQDIIWFGSSAAGDHKIDRSIKTVSGRYSSAI